MRAKVNYFFSPDVDLDNFHPDDTKNFSFLLQAMVGPADVPDSGESLQFIVCTPQNLEERVAADSVIFGRALVVVGSSNADEITGKVRKVIEQIQAPTWQELAQKLARLGIYEFEDF
ncbi:Imm8 family immunity protein [Streptomyces gilvus]|uniref:Imm8 family immunity protein n=1 Tax=Streptomyces gilvus TaxID=2920937 RepID=UPI001F0F1C2C|nr:Imm8 family immunity protein [Streptomyces sp. CME 23]MCH5675106.1 immunity 8 family protein [Streptomyces sp. CME 23]